MRRMRRREDGLLPHDVPARQVFGLEEEAELRVYAEGFNCAQRFGAEGISRCPYRTAPEIPPDEWEKASTWHAGFEDGLKGIAEIPEWWDPEGKIIPFPAKRRA